MNLRTRGMTMVELMLALSVTSMIAVTATGVTVSLLNARESTERYVENVQAGRISLAQIERLIRTSKLVTATSPATLVLWNRDDSDPGQVNLDELIVLEYKVNEGFVEMSKVSFPPSMSESTRDALNDTVSLARIGSHFDAINEINATTKVQTTPIATGLSTLTFRCDSAPPYTQSVAIEARFGNAGESIALHTSAALRGSAVKWVEEHAGTAVLTLPDTSVADVSMPYEGQ